MSAFVPPGDCPNCGETVPAGAAACPYCGADERTGWSEDTYLDGIELPEDAGTDYERMIERETGDGLPTGVRAWFSFGLVLLLALMISGVWWWLR
jgi:glutaredoxin